MKINLLTIILSCLLFVSGCSTTSNKPKLSYPADIKTMCENARNDAISCIGNVKVSKSLVLEKRPNCVKKYGYWAWQEPSIKNVWVLGATWKRGNGYYIQVSCNPKTMGEVRYGTVKHEHGHYFLWSNFGDPSHNPKYKGCFENWNDPRVKTRAVMLDGEEVIIDYIEAPDEEAEKPLELRG